MNVEIPQLLDEAAAAALLGVSRATLAVWRCTHRYNLPFVKVGRLVRYRAADVAAFIESRRVVAGQPRLRK